MTLENKILKILVTYPDTRDSDRALIVKTYENLGYNTMQPFEKIVLDTDAPSFETIRRTRQKLQAKYPEVKASQKIADARCEKELEYIAYAIGEKESL